VDQLTPEEVLGTLRQVMEEVAPDRLATPVTLDSRLDRDLGLDSLATVEVLDRLGELLGVEIPDSALAAVDTPRDLVRIVSTAGPAAHPQASNWRHGPTSSGPRSAPVLTARTASTLVEVLQAHATADADRVHLRLLGEEGERSLTYGELLDAAAAVGRGLNARYGIEPGDTVALMLPTSIDYFVTFFGVLLAGAVPVPIYPPARPSQLEDHLRRHARILDNAQVTLLVTVPEAVTVGRLLRGKVLSLRHVLTPDVLAAPEGLDPRPRLGAHDLALLQYTSGSTGDPKGVALTHANLLANIRAMADVARVDETDVFVSWLPLYHDMGLIGAWLGSLTRGCPLVVMSPLSFLARPARWLWAIHDARGTLSAAPNFGFELCLTKVADDDIVGLDLSSWRLAFNGAEPVSPETIERFTSRFGPYGLRPEAMAPVYGLAENSVGLTFPPVGRGPVVDRVDRDRFLRDGRAEPAPPDDPTALRVVACGSPLPGHRIRLVDSAGAEVGTRQEGRIEFRGPSATSGYHRNPEATNRLFHGDWLDTGDLGYLADGDLYVTGRVKDLVIRGGRNLHPEELELAVGEIPGVRRGRVAAFGVPDPASGTERLVVEAETTETDEGARRALHDAVIEVSVDLLGTPPDEVVLAAPGTVLKTSSGKIRRAASRDLYERGESPTTRPPWWQIARFAATTAAPRIRRARRAAAGVRFGFLARLWVALLAPWVWLAVVLFPRRSWRWSVLRAAARIVVRATRTPVDVTGAEHLPPDGPLVVVANHASWLDALIVALAVPGDVGFVAASEFSRHRAVRLFLQRIGTDFVVRTDRDQAVVETRRLVERARRGDRLVIFPEGRLSPVPGLRSFHLGAFVIAATVGCPVVPVTIRGTRQMLRPGTKRVRPGAVAVTVGSPIAADEPGWAGALRLRDRARAAIRVDCDEPDLEEAGRVRRREPAGVDPAGTLEVT
jgi:1-acyl-sn-glycerol-3-phosphate acyltransferase